MLNSNIDIMLHMEAHHNLGKRGGLGFGDVVGEHALCCTLNMNVTWNMV